MLIGSDRDKGGSSLCCEGRMVPEQQRQLGKRTLFHETGGTTDSIYVPQRDIMGINYHFVCNILEALKRAALYSMKAKPYSNCVFID